MEFNPKNYNQSVYPTLELANRADSKNRKMIKRELRSYGLDRVTINLLVNDGYRGSLEIYDATEVALLSIHGIGRIRLSRIRRALLPYFLSPV
jgi:hypothetical protein